MASHSSSAPPSPAAAVDGAGDSEEDPEIVSVSPSAAPASHSASSTSPPVSPTAAASAAAASASPLPSPVSSTGPPSSRRTASSGGASSGNGYVSAQQKRANMDLTGLGSPPSSGGDSTGGGGRALQQSSSGSFLSSFAKKLTLNTAAAGGGAAAASVASPTAHKPSPQAAAGAGSKSSSGTISAAPPTGRLSASSPSPPHAASASSSAAPTSPAPPLSPSAASSASSSSSSSSLAASSSAGGGKRSLTSSFGSMFRSLSLDPSARDGGGAGGSTAAGGALSQTEQQKEQHKREWQSLLPPPSANGVTATPPPSQSFSNPKVKARCVKLAWYGIPSSVRGDAWQWIIGNSLNITEDLFWIMSGRAQEVKENKMRRLEREEAEREAAANGASGGAAAQQQQQSDKPSLSREESVSLIETDIRRTFPELKFFHDGGPLQAPLYQVLESYGCYRPDVGYVQGMSHIAAMLLLNVEPLPAFIAICNLLNQEMYFKFFRMNAQQMKLHLSVFQQVFKDQLPQLYNHFASLGIEPDMYLYDWLLTIFTRALPLDVTHRVWDNFLCVGHVFLFRTSLGLLRLQQATFMQASFEQALALLNRPPKTIDGDALFDSIARITVTAEKLSKMLQEAEG